LPKLSGPATRPTASFAMFLMMVVGVGVVGIALTVATDGACGIRELLAVPRLRRLLICRRTGHGAATAASSGRCSGPEVRIGRPHGVEAAADSWK
jgi:hypothetical protein